MKNSHFVPKLILKKFADKLCLYNIKTGELKENVKLEKAYSQIGFYDDDIEIKFNTHLESRFAQLLNNKILNCESSVELSRAELRLTKKFLLLSIIRSIASEELMNKEKHFYDDIINILEASGKKLTEDDEKRIRPFLEKQIPNESNRDYWMRTLNVILETDGSPEEILKHPNKTYPAFRWARVVNSGFLAFWDSEYDSDEFVITDVGMTSENEKGWNGISNHNNKKRNFLFELYQHEKDTILRGILEKQIYFIQFFNENFQMFPISAKRMIVLIAPFYKFRFECKNIYNMPNLNDLTNLVNEELYHPNEVKYILSQTGSLPTYHEEDKYIYKIKKLNKDETRYCNALFLDRINTTLGFSSLNKIISSVLLYKKLNSYPYSPRVDYTKLYEIIYKKKQII